MLVTMHHIVSDGWSMGVLVREVSALYEAFAGGHGRRRWPEPPVQYADYAAWQRELADGRGARGAARATGGSRLAGLPAAGAADRPAAAGGAGHRGGRAVPVVLGPAALEAAAGAGAREGATLFMTLLAAFQALLHRYTARTTSRWARRSRAGPGRSWRG